MQNLIIKKVKDLEPIHIFECGQCFRWKKEEDGSYTGVIKEGVLNIKKEKEDVYVEGEVKGDIMKIVDNYFDMERDYSNIKRILCLNDNYMLKATKYGYGIRILKQDPWETLISFIISAANNIPRISRTIENISKSYGDEITFKGNTYYLFPTPAQLSKAKIEDLRKLNLGFRDKYIYEATRLVNEKKVNLNSIKSMDTINARKELIKIPGVGAKVADCILLFSMGKIESFPVDTWIKKVMSELYTDSANITKISEYASNKFGKYGGIAQQYLFYYRRSS